MKASALLVVVALGACGKGESEKKGSLCLAGTPKNVLAGGAYQDKAVEIRFRGNRYPVPGDQVMIWDLHENEGVEALVDGKVKESFRTHFDKLGADLCYHFRGANPGTAGGKPVKEGFVLETASACGCMGGSDGSAGTGSGSGS